MQGKAHHALADMLTALQVTKPLLGQRDAKKDKITSEETLWKLEAKLE